MPKDSARVTELFSFSTSEDRVVGLTIAFSGLTLVFTVLPKGDVNGLALEHEGVDGDPMAVSAIRVIRSQFKREDTQSNPRRDLL